MIVNVSEAKAKLSKLIDLVFHGEKVVIAKNNLPLVDLVIHKPSGKRKLGVIAGEIEISEENFKEDEEISQLFYGENDEIILDTHTVSIGDFRTGKNF